MINGPGPGPRTHQTTTVVGSKLFVFGGQNYKKTVNDMWTLDLNRRTFSLLLLRAILTRYFRSKISTFLGVL